MTEQTPAQRAVGDFAPKLAELKEALINLAFYAGWPKVMSAIQVAKRVFAK
jgi:alkylhydroperoxidase/carboxymuconolactone decarboxylase family protein YurZ